MKMKGTDARLWGASACFISISNEIILKYMILILMAGCGGPAR